MKNKLSITIGIPAYNEEKNITNLLLDISKQGRRNFILDKIILLSDGSTDNTVLKAKQIKEPKLIILHNQKRMGKHFSLDKIIENTNSDVLIIFDADIRIPDKNLIADLIAPIYKNYADLVAVKIEEMPPQTLVQKLLFASMKYKKYMYETFRGGDNVYACYGKARAFSKRLYSVLSFKQFITD